MKISKETIAIMRNFATINGNLLIKPGNVLSTISASKTVFASAEVKETFPEQFGIYDLNEFLGVMSLFDDAEIEFGGKFATFKAGRNSLKYFGAEESVLTAPSKVLKVPPADIEFQITNDQVNSIMKTAGVLRAPDITIEGSNGELKIVIGDKKHTTSNNHVMVVGDIDSTFKANLKVEYFKILPGDYTVEIAAKRICTFKAGTLCYTIGLEADSSFED
jgi:hypothetical protein